MKRSNPATIARVATELDSGPLVSIIIPCFNCERFLGAAIDSALGQTYPRIEVIVVDDGSNDGSYEVLEEYADRIRIERLDVNSGPSAARNAGVSLARGEFIQFLDADDLLHAEKVEECLRAYQPGVGLVFTQNSYFRDDQRGRSRRGRSWFMQMLNDRLRRPAMEWDPLQADEYVLRREIQTAAPLHRASSLRASGGFREELWSLEDLDLHFRLVCTAGQVRKVRKVLVQCRHHGSPTRLRVRQGRFSVALRALDRINEEATANNRLRSGVRSALADRYANIGRKLLWEGHDTEAIRAIQTSLDLSRRPNPTGVPVYNLFARAIGLVRFERIIMRLSGLIAPPVLAFVAFAPPSVRTWARRNRGHRGVGINQTPLWPDNDHSGLERVTGPERREHEPKQKRGKDDNVQSFED